MKIFYAICLMILMIGCSEQIKNDKKIQDEVQSSPSDTSSNSSSSESLGNNNVIIKNKENLIGNWVGWFESDMGNQDNDLEDEVIYWGRENKITISIEEIEGGNVKGHSIVAGNYRPFSGTISDLGNEFTLELKEPGDNQYDGSFQISMEKNQKILSGKWKAYKSIQIKIKHFIKKYGSLYSLFLS